MDAAAVVTALFERMEARQWPLVAELVSDDAIIDWTASGERFVGSSFVAMNQAYPEGWTIELVEVLARGNRVAAQIRVLHQDSVFWCAAFYTVECDQITSGVEHWVTAGSERPPGWRSAFTADIEH